MGRRRKGDRGHGRGIGNIMTGALQESIADSGGHGNESKQKSSGCK